MSEFWIKYKRGWVRREDESNEFITSVLLEQLAPTHCNICWEKWSSYGFAWFAGFPRCWFLLSMLLLGCPAAVIAACLEKESPVLIWWGWVEPRGSSSLSAVFHTPMEYRPSTNHVRAPFSCSTLHGLPTLFITVTHSCDFLGVHSSHFLRELEVIWRSRLPSAVRATGRELNSGPLLLTFH